MIGRRKKAGNTERRNPIDIVIFMLFFLGCGSRMPPPGKPDIDPPVVKITYPGEMDTVKGTVYVKYNYEDRSLPRLVSLYVDGIRTVLDSMQFMDSLMFKSDTLLDGIHRLQVVAQDKWDNVGKSKVVSVVTSNGNKKEGEDERMGGEHKRVKEKSR